jgi:hypothetical protein
MDDNLHESSQCIFLRSPASPLYSLSRNEEQKVQRELLDELNELHIFKQGSLCMLYHAVAGFTALVF